MTMKKFLMTIAAVLCCAMTTTEVKAQRTVEEALKEAEAAAKLADANPTDGKKQYKAAVAFISDDMGDKMDTNRALEYANKALKIALAQPVPQDTLKGLTYYALGIINMKKQNAENTFNYMEKAMDAFEEELGKGDPVTIGTKLIYAQMMVYSQPFRAFPKIQEAFYDNAMAPENNRIENMDEANISLELALEAYIAAQINYFQNALPLITFEGKKYLVVQTRDWNMERPLVGWQVQSFLRSEEDEKNFVGDDIIICDENYQFTVIPVAEKDKIQMSFNFNHAVGNPRKLKGNDGDSRLFFLNPNVYQELLTKFRAFKNNK